MTLKNRVHMVRVFLLPYAERPITIASLVVQLSATVDKLKAGLDQGVNYTRQYAARQQRILDNAGSTAKAQAQLDSLRRAYDITQQSLDRFAKASNGAFRDVNTGKFVSPSFVGALQGQLDTLGRAGNATRDHISALQKDTAEQERLSAALQRSIGVQAASNAETQRSVDVLQRQIAAAKLSEFGSSATALGGKLSLYVTAPLVAAATAAANFGLQADLAATRMNIVFGGTASQVNQRIAQLRQTIPATTAELQKFTASLTEEYLALGLVPSKAREMSLELLRVAGALAQFKGRSVEDALNAIRSATNGMTRPLRDFGVLLDQGSIKLEAQRLGLSRHGEQLTQLGRIQAAYSLILQRSQIQQNAAAELAGTAANRIKFTTANLREARDVIGQQLLPVMVPLAEVISNIADKLAHLNPETIKTGLYFAAIAAAAGPLLSIIGGVSSAMSVLITRIGLLEGESALGGLAVLLTPGGLVLGGLALLAGAFYLIEKAADSADSATLKYRQSLSGLTSEEINHQITVNRLALAQAQAANNEALNSKVGRFQLGAEVAFPALAPFLPDVSGADALGGQVAKIRGTLDTLYDLRKKFSVLPPAPAGIDTRTSIPGGDPAAQALKDQAAGIRLVVENLHTARANGEGVAEAIQAGFLAEQRLSDAIKGAAGHVQRLRDLQGQYNAVVAAVKFPAVTLPTIKAPDIYPALDAKKIAAGAASALGSDALLKPLRDAAEQAALLRAELEIRSAGRVAQGKTPLNIDAAFKIQRQYAEVAGAAAAKAIAASNLPLEVQKGLYDQILKYMDAMGVKATKLKQPFDGVAASLSKAVGLLRSLGDLANASGDAKLGNLLNTGANLASNASLAFASGGADIGADIGALTSTIALFKEAFGGKDQAELERIAVTRSNIAALQQNTIKLSGFVTSASNTVGAANALNALFANKAALGGVAANQSGTASTLGAFGILGGAVGLLGLKRNTGDLQSQLNALNPVLKQFGLTFDQLTAIAKTYGVTLTDKSGRLVVGALDQLRTGFLEAAKAAFSFSNSFADQNALSELRAKLAGPTTPASDLKRQVALIQSLAPSLLPGSFDTTAATGQQALRAGLSSLIEGIASKTIDPSAFGGFSNLSELTGVVGSVIDALNGMQNSVNGVTQSLVNLAPYFKVDAARYNATLPNTLTSASGFSGGLTPLSPSVVPTVTATVTQSFGDININGTNKDPNQIATEVLKELQRRSLAASGTTTKWSQVQS